MPRAKLPPSHKRVRGGIIGECILCLRVAPLRLGHVVPRWMYTWVKAEGGGRLHGQYPSLGIEHEVTQDAPKHYSLCESCEQLMSVSEQYMRDLMVGGPDGWSRIGVREDSLVLNGLDFSLIQRFLLGTALRAHFGTGAEFHSLHLPLEQVDRIRRALVSGPALDTEFPTIAVRYVSTRFPDADPRAFVYPMLLSSPGHALAFSLFAAGWDWRVFLCGDDSSGAGSFFDYRLRAGTGFLAVVYELADCPFLRAIVPHRNQATG